MPQAHRGQIPVRWKPGEDAEGARKVERAEPRGSSEIGECQCPAVVRFDEIHRAVDPPHQPSEL